MNQFTFDGKTASSYNEGPPKQVPGYSDLHKMISLLLSERTPEQGKVLVLGAGGGQELKALAESHKGWTFDGVDPSADMLSLAKQRTKEHADRIKFHLGYIESAPNGPFDAATAILTFHFIPKEQRHETLEHIRKRLKPGAPFVLVHLSFPQSEPERSLWLKRHLAYGLLNGTDPVHAESAMEAMRSKLTILSPAEEEQGLAKAGFANTSLFYAGLSIKGWVTYAE